MNLQEFTLKIDLSGRSPDELRKTFGAAKLLIVSDMKRNISEGTSPGGAAFRPLAWPRISGGSKPLRDTGLLLASLTSGQGHVEEVTPNSLKVGTNLRYASLHQFGGVVTPKKGKFLAIPASKEAKRAGSPRNFPRPLVFVGKNKSVRGALVEMVAAKKTGKRRKRGTNVPSKRPWITHYYLVKQVQIPARPYAGFSDQLSQKIERLFAEFLAKQI